MLKINEQIAWLRKKKNLSQEELANMLQVTNQAVSKWESGQNCPDINLIPQIAKVFNVTISELFGEEVKDMSNYEMNENEDLKVVVMQGDKIIKYVDLNHEVKGLVEKVTIELTGNCNAIECCTSIIINGDIKGNASAGDYLNCTGNIGLSVDAGDSVTCGNVNGNVNAGDSVRCGVVGGGVSAGDEVIVSGDVHGNIIAGDGVKIIKQEKE